jgi:hypothetical protein
MTKLHGSMRAYARTLAFAICVPFSNDRVESRRPCHKISDNESFPIRSYECFQFFL